MPKDRKERLLRDLLRVVYEYAKREHVTERRASKLVEEVDNLATEHQSSPLEE